ncbi:MAG: SPFH domain-containing protein [Bacilli bacterium]
MGKIGYFLEKFRNLKNKNTRNPNEKVLFDSELELEHIELVTATKNGFHRIKSGEALALVRQFLNPEADAELKGSGYRFSLPFLYAPYYIDISKYTVNVKDTSNSDGRYRQDVGLGDDIIIKLKVTFEVSNSETAAKQLIKNSFGCISAIRATSEELMRCIIAQNYKAPEKPEKSEETSKIDIAAYEKIPKSKSFNLEEVLYTENNSLDDNQKEIAAIASKLLRDYGVLITDVHFVDIDKSEKLKNIITNASEEEKKREIEKAKADADLYVAEKHAQAETIKRNVDIEILKKMKENLDLSENTMGKIIQTKSLPEKTIAIMNGNGNGNVASEVLAAKMAYDNEEYGDTQRDNYTKGRRR